VICLTKKTKSKVLCNLAFSFFKYYTTLIGGGNLIIDTNEVLKIILAVEKHFKIDLKKFNDYVKENNFVFEEKNNSFVFTGYTEIHDFFRLCVNFNELEPFRFDFYKIVISKDSVDFYDFKDKLLFEKKIDQEVDLKNVPYKALIKFLKD